MCQCIIGRGMIIGMHRILRPAGPTLLLSLPPIYLLSRLPNQPPSVLSPNCGWLPQELTPTEVTGPRPGEDGPRKPGGGGHNARRSSLVLAQAWADNARRRVSKRRECVGDGRIQIVGDAIRAGVHRLFNGPGSGRRRTTRRRTSKDD